MYPARQRGARWGKGLTALRARYVCDLHENARRSYRSIEPAGEPGYDVRTFECPECNHSENVTIKFR